MTIFHPHAANERREILPGAVARFVHGDGFTLAQWELAPGTIIPEHTHPHEQAVTIVTGEFEMTVGSETRRMMPGDSCVIASGIPHSARAITACQTFDFFTPAREDYKRGQAGYLLENGREE